MRTVEKLGKWLLHALGVLSLLSIYAFYAWFFPSDLFVSLLVGPAILSAILAAYLVHTNLDAGKLKRAKTSKGIFFFMALTMTPILVMYSFGIGFPALITKAARPNGEVVTSVSMKEQTHSRRRCAFEVGFDSLSTPIKRDICVTQDLFDRLRVGQKVSLSVWSSSLGTRIFDIKPLE